MSLWLDQTWTDGEKWIVLWLPWQPRWWWAVLYKHAHVYLPVCVSFASLSSCPPFCLILFLHKSSYLLDAFLSNCLSVWLCEFLTIWLSAYLLLFLSACLPAYCLPLNLLVLLYARLNCSLRHNKHLYITSLVISMPFACFFTCLIIKIVLFEGCFMCCYCCCFSISLCKLPTILSAASVHILPSCPRLDKKWILLFYREKSAQIPINQSINTLWSINLSSQSHTRKTNERKLMS